MTDQTLSADLLKTIETTCTCFQLRKAARIVTQLFDERLKPSGLLGTQFTVLTAIASAQPASISELATGLGMDRTTLTRNLKPLEKQGWIAIAPGDDQRVRLVALTESGRAVLLSAIPLWEGAQQIVKQQLGQTQWQILLLGLSETTDRLAQYVA